MLSANSQFPFLASCDIPRALSRLHISRVHVLLGRDLDLGSIFILITSTHSIPCNQPPSRTPSSCITCPSPRLSLAEDNLYSSQLYSDLYILDLTGSCLYKAESVLRTLIPTPTPIDSLINTSSPCLPSFHGRHRSFTKRVRVLGLARSFGRHSRTRNTFISFRNRTGIKRNKSVV